MLKSQQGYVNRKVEGFVWSCSDRIAQRVKTQRQISRWWGYTHTHTGWNPAECLTKPRYLTLFWAPSKPWFEKSRKKNKKRAQWIILVGLHSPHHLYPQFFKSWFCFGGFVVVDAFFPLASSRKIHVLYNKGCLYLENDYLAGSTSLKVMEVF